MRQDISDILRKRPSWILHNDEEYQLLLQGLKYAQKGFNQPAIDEFKVLIEQRRTTLLEGI